VDSEANRENHFRKVWCELSFSLCSPASARDENLVSNARHSREKTFAGGCRSVDQNRLASHQKKAKKLKKSLVFADESGFNLTPEIRKTWSPIGETPILSTPIYRQHHSALGLIHLSPRRKKCRFHFTIQPGAILTEHLIFWLTALHHFYKKPMILVGDNLPGHRAAAQYFLEHHPDWFDFEFFPPYSPELNPTESCWNHIKSVDLANFVPENSDELVAKTLSAAKKINDDQELIRAFFDHAKLKL
jgi:transposase